MNEQAWQERGQEGADTGTGGQGDTVMGGEREEGLWGSGFSVGMEQPGLKGLSSRSWGRGASGEPPVQEV